MKTKLSVVVAAFMLFAISLIGPASASTITWAVSLIFEDGGTGSGSFTIDPSTLVLSSVDITTTPGTSPVWIATIHYSLPLPPTAINSTDVAFNIPATESLLQLFLNAGSLSVAATSISVTALESNQDLFEGGVDIRDGWGTISATPLPGALPLFATGLAALGLLGWRRKRKAEAIT
jgi:hypothetical protein